MQRILGIFVFFILVGCSKTNPIKDILSSKNTAIKTIIDSLEQYEVQIIYTRIDSTETGLDFTDYEFQVDPKNYFYPASTVKLPTALLAAEYIANHPELTIDTPYSIEKDSIPHTIADDIKQIFAVSDNEAYNRLYVLLGRDYINKRLKEIGLKKTRIAHRLSTQNPAVNSRRKIQLYPSYEGPVFIPDTLSDTAVTPLKGKSITKGQGYIKEGNLVSMSMDFSLKNAFPLEEQHQFMKQLFFPDKVRSKHRIQLKPSEELRIKNMMQTLPREVGYDQKTYYDSYGKFFIYGDSKDSIPSHIKIYNKVGYAFGTLTETAYIVDEIEDVHFMLSATILVNKNRIFNDDIYEYDSIGIPFLAALGREFHQYSIDNRRVD